MGRLIIVMHREMPEQPDPATTLRAIVSEGIAIDLFHAHEAASLSWEIGEKADAINRATFGAFFGSIQIIFGRFQALSVARMFECSSARFTLRTIPGAISVLRAHRHALPIEQRPGLEDELCRLGAEKHELSALSDEELTTFVADFFESRLRNIVVGELTGDELLENVKLLRDKVLAHHEHVDFDAMRKPTYVEFDALLQFAREFVSAVGFGYFSIAYTDDSGAYGLDLDATRSTRSLRRLLARVGVPGDDA